MFTLLINQYKITFEIQHNYYRIFHGLTRQYYLEKKVCNPDSVIFKDKEFKDFIKWVENQPIICPCCGK